jgi:hypothetical protein
MGRRQLLQRLDTAWRAFEESYAGLSDAQLMKPGVTGDWSVRDILAHVSTWEEEALTHLPLIQRAPEDPLGREPRFRRRLRLDTYGHYPLHAKAIRQWRRNVAVPTAAAGLDPSPDRLGRRSDTTPA